MDAICDITGGIVCATRGGEGSEPTVQHAIARARELELPLTFLYIADVEFMKQTEMGHASVVAEEMMKMGEFIMMTLVERAQQEDVTADVAVRQGEFREQLLGYVDERKPDLLVLGCPLPDSCYFQPDSLAALALEIKERTGVDVELM
jgi:nucleotide-binding universal stress UspA family protein